MHFMGLCRLCKVRILGGGADPIYSNAPLTALVTASESGRSSRTPVHWLLDRQHTRSIVLVRLLADKAGQLHEAAERGQQYDKLPDFWLYSAALSLLDWHPAAVLFCISEGSPDAKDAYVFQSKIYT